MAESRIIPTAKALAEIVTDPVLKALILQRPHLALIILTHPQDHLLITDGGVQVQRGIDGREGSISIATSSGQGDSPPGCCSPGSFG
jgi:hypothetical protein